MTAHVTAISAEDTPQTARQPWLHDLRVAVNGNVTALSAPNGDMGAVVDGSCSATGAQGVYVDDRRAVSVLTVQLGDESPVPVADASSGERSDFLSSARQLGNPGADPTVEVRRARTVTVQGITEVVDVVSRADEAVETDLVLCLGGDGSPISVVKSGAATGGLLPVTPLAGRDTAGADRAGAPGPGRLSGVSWCDEWHRTDVTLDPAQQGRGVATRALTAVIAHLMSERAAHRVLMTYEAEAEGISSDHAIKLLLERVPLP